MTDEKYSRRNRIDYLGNFPGARRERDTVVVEVAGGELDSLPEPVEIEQPDDSVLTAALSQPVGVEDSTGSQVDPATESTLAAIDTKLDGTLDVSASFEATTVGINDSTGTQIDPDPSPEYPASQTVGHDLTGNDLVLGPVSVARSSSVVISANSTSGNSFSVSVDWEDGNGNVFQTESETDIAMSGITQDWSRLVRKGPQVEVTLTDTSGATTNNVNAHLDTEK